MKDEGKTILSIMVATLAISALITAPVMAKSLKNPKKPASHSSAAAAAEATSSVPDTLPAPKVGHLDTKPGPAWKTVGGTVKHIKGDTYTVEDYEGNQVQLYVGQGTKQLRGNKKVGDTVRAEITRGGFANSIQ
ncbi:MAG: hypothetical protein HY038_11610 [Nitrospirae bacterium]|nr:hypothetical protein [Nitrospirota bacterium]